MTAKKKLPIGVQSFRKIRQADYYYVDKTAFVLSLIEEGSDYFVQQGRDFFGSQQPARSDRGRAVFAPEMQLSTFDVDTMPVETLLFQTLIGVEFSRRTRSVCWFEVQKIQPA